MIVYYQGENNNHVKNAKHNFILGINDFLKNNSWFTLSNKRATFVKFKSVKPPKVKLPKPVEETSMDLYSPVKPQFNPIHEMSPIKANTNPFEVQAKPMMKTVDNRPIISKHISEPVTVPHNDKRSKLEDK